MAEVSRCFHRIGRPETVALPDAISEVHAIAEATPHKTAKKRTAILFFIILQVYRNKITLFPPLLQIKSLFNYVWAFDSEAASGGEEAYAGGYFGGMARVVGRY